MSKFYVYLWINRVNGKRYIGKGHGTRAWSHIRESEKNQPKGLLANAIKKHGVSNFQLTMLHTDLLESEAFELETFYITGLKTNVCQDGIGYNLTSGGEGASGHKRSDETRKRMSEAQRNPSSETRQKLSEANRRRKGTATIETRAKISIGNKGKRYGAEARWKISQANRHRHSKNRINKVFVQCFADPKFPAFMQSWVSSLS